MTRLALLRHGHTAWNRAGRIQGRTDIPLDDEAAAALADLCLPAPWSKAALCASPLSRAVETARLVGGRPPETLPALMEMDWGDWEGRHSAEVHDEPESGFRHVETWGWDFCPPRGESPNAMRTRLEPWLNNLTKDTVAVCHIGVMRVILALATGWNFDGPAPFQIKRNRLYLLEKQGADWQLDPTPLRLLERPV